MRLQTVNKFPKTVILTATKATANPTNSQSLWAKEFEFAVEIDFYSSFLHFSSLLHVIDSWEFAKIMSASGVDLHSFFFHSRRYLFHFGLAKWRLQRVVSRRLFHKVIRLASSWIAKIECRRYSLSFSDLFNPLINLGEAIYLHFWIEVPSAGSFSLDIGQPNLIQLLIQISEAKSTQPTTALHKNRYSSAKSHKRQFLRMLFVALTAVHRFDLWSGSIQWIRSSGRKFSYVSTFHFFSDPGLSFFYILPEMLMESESLMLPDHSSHLLDPSPSFPTRQFSRFSI